MTHHNTCSFAGCGKPVNAYGLCRQHRRQQRDGKPLATLRDYNRSVLKREVNDPQDMFCRIPPGHQRCTVCEVVKPLSEFHNQKSSANNVAGYCKECHSDKALDRRYGEGAAKWKRRKLAEQGGVCEDCKAPTPGGRGGWHLDHDHETGEWRDVLCAACNTARGFIDRLGWDVEAFVKSLKDKGFI